MEEKEAILCRKGVEKAIEALIHQEEAGERFRRQEGEMEGDKIRR